MFSISKSAFGQTDLGKNRYLSLSTQIAADARRRDLGAPPAAARPAAADQPDLDVYKAGGYHI